MWYVIYTHALKELEAEKQIKNQGWEAYLPIFKKRVSHARKIRFVPSPLFPRYLFVKKTADLRLSQLSYTKGVHSILKMTHLPAILDDDIINLFKMKEDEGGFIQTETILPFKKGDPIQIKEGPFKNQVATFQNMTSENRVAILLDILGQKNSIHH